MKNVSHLWHGQYCQITTQSFWTPQMNSLDGGASNCHLPLPLPSVCSPLHARSLQRATIQTRRHQRTRAYTNFLTSTRQWQQRYGRKKCNRLIPQGTHVKLTHRGKTWPVVQFHVLFINGPPVHFITHTTSSTNATIHCNNYHKAMTKIVD